MGSPKLLFFDIDLTLWDRQNFIPESTVRALKAAQANGHKIFLNSGRSRSYIRKKELLDIGFDGIVSGDGVRIEMGDEVLFSRVLDKDLAIRAVETCRRHGFWVMLEGPHHLYFDMDEFQNDAYAQKVRSEMEEDYRPLSDLWGEWETDKLSCATPVSDEERLACYEELKDDFDFLVHGPIVTEMVPKGFNKGTGIRFLCEHLGVPVEDTFAFGDSMNDIDMLKAAGTSVCMGNGQEEAKAASDYVTATLWEDGIEKALKHFGLI